MVIVKVLTKDSVPENVHSIWGNGFAQLVRVREFPLDPSRVARLWSHGVVPSVHIRSLISVTWIADLKGTL